MILKLSRKSVVEFTIEELMLRVLLDSGASISVFTKSEKAFIKKFKNVVYSGYDTLIGGFGGEGCIVPVYIILELKIGSVTMTNLPVAIYPMNHISADLILSSYVLKNNKFSIDFKNRTLEIQEGDIFCKYIVEKDFVTKFAVFTQEEKEEKGIIDIYKRVVI